MMGLDQDKKIWGEGGDCSFFRGEGQMRLRSVAVNFGASGFVRFLGSLSCQLCGSGCGG